MKRILRALGCILLCVSALCSPAEAADAPAISAAAAAVMHVETGTVVFEKNADGHMLIASTTKIMTALVVLEHCDLREPVEILPEYTAVEGSSMYLRAGETYTVEELLYGLMLASGNDAATALACHTAGSIEAFAQLMNDKAAELGLENTSFRNPHGLDAEGHYSTASDLASLACYAMQNEQFRAIVSTNSITIGSQTYTNHNRLLRTYPGALGVKTGYTEAAGRILVSCARRDNTQFVCVTLSDPNDWDDHTRLLDWAFDEYEYREVTNAETAYPLPVLSGTDELCTAVPEQTVSLFLKKDTPVNVEVKLPRYVFAPVVRGDAAGSLTITPADGAAVDVPLVYSADVPLDFGVKLTLRERFSRAWGLAGHYLFAYYPKN